MSDDIRDNILREGILGNRSSISKAFSGAEDISKARRRKYEVGEISPNTGLQKQPDGSWAPPKKGIKISDRGKHGEDRESLKTKLEKELNQVIDEYSSKIGSYFKIPERDLDGAEIAVRMGREAAEVFLMDDEKGSVFGSDIELRVSGPFGADDDLEISTASLRTSGRGDAGSARILLMNQALENFEDIESDIREYKKKREELYNKFKNLNSSD